MSSTVIGIDLGTTFSLAARSEDGTPAVIRDEHGTAQVPSVICFDDDGSVLVGSEARKRALSDPDHTVYSVKRLMGRTLDDLQKELELIPYQVIEREVEADRRVLHVKIGDREFTPEELSAMILRELRQRAGNPDKAVITVPAYFDDSQRQATRDAGRIAGLDVLRIVNEPTAAALAYGLQNKDNGTIAVYDLGGGTFDCSILSLSDGVFKVLATNGDTFLGGDDFDRAVMSVVARELGIDLNSRDAELLQHLRDQAERVKIALSDADAADFVLRLRDIDYRRTFTREEFESLITPFIDRTLQKCRRALRDAEKKPADVDEAVLVGGSTRIPLVRRKVAEFFGREPHCDLNPDEVVALGAAVQADILAGGRKSMLLLDVVPLSLGIETLGGVVDKVIHRNTTIPARATARYSTGVDNQTAVVVKIYQGERELTKDCRYLGEFKLSGVPPMPAQMPQVDVTFLVDANGMLTVSAKEQRSGQQAEVTVKPGHGLNKDEVDQMVRDSIDYAQQDFTQRRLIELRNKAEGDLRHTEKALAQAGDRLDDETRSRIDGATKNLRDAVRGEDVDLLHNRVDELGNATLPLAHLLMDAVAKGVLEGRTPDKMED